MRIFKHCTTCHKLKYLKKAMPRHLNWDSEEKSLTYLCTLRKALDACLSTPTTCYTRSRGRTFSAVAPFLGKPKNVFC